MIKGSLCMLISNPDFRVVESSIKSAVRHLSPLVSEVILGYSSRAIGDGWPDRLDPLFPARIKVRRAPGADIRPDVARARFDLFDSAEGDWLISLDDDDAAIGTPSLTDAPAGAGFWHCNIIGICQASTGDMKPGDFIERQSTGVASRLGAHMLRGSMYAYRRAAWQEVSPLLDRSFMEYEEWRVAWHMLRLGWKGHHEQRAFQIQRMRDFHAEADAQWKTGVTWVTVCRDLEKEFGSPTERYWQNWDNPAYLSAIRQHWVRDRNQPERRLHFKGILAELSGEFPAGTPVLDFGCGAGEDHPTICEAGWEYHGCDVSSTMLEQHRAAHPGAALYEDDVLKSGWEDRSWPLVVCSSVLPHLPMERMGDAINELWRITERCLVVRLFGVDEFPDDRNRIAGGFLFQSLREKTWRQMFDDVGAQKIETHIGTEKAKDVMVVVLWR